MLIKTYRHTIADLERWEEYEEYDSLHNVPMAKVDQTLDVMRQFSEENEKSCLMCSWGKDSVVLLHLFLQLKINRPVVYQITKHRSNPECLLVRDEFLKMYEFDYKEHVFSYEQVEKDGNKHWRELANLYGKRISGLRNDESSTRKMQFFINGFASENSCRPLSKWTTKDIFSYAYHNEIPLCPAYGFLGGGRYDRSKIRTHSMSSPTDLAGSGMGRLEWEKEYYPDMVARQKYAEYRRER